MKKYLFLLLLLSCAGPNKIMSSWLGEHQSKLYQQWGPPHHITEDGAGGKILIYYSTVTNQVPGMIVNQGNGVTTYTTPMETGYEKNRMFYVDTDGRIYAFRWKGY
jgi:hypothetical protein